MKGANRLDSLEETDKRTSLARTLREYQETCKKCDPLTPLVCVTNCRIWKMKNELIVLAERIKKPSYISKLLNTLKNERRLKMLEMISKAQYSAARLQKELRKLGYDHSERTIVEEYLAPLIEAGLAQENHKEYYATLFGCRVNELMNFHNIEGVLPPHSEGYEEIALSELLKKPKTYKDFGGTIPLKNIARVLNRLQRARLIETARENNYVFYFRTKRDSTSSRLSPTERRVYQSISTDGIHARKIAERTRISLRRTYRYLRKLKGKKLIFTRVRPKSYALTSNGLQVALILKRISDLVAEAQAVANHVINTEETHKLLKPAAYKEKSGEDRAISLAAINSTQ